MFALARGRLACGGQRASSDPYDERTVLRSFGVWN
jgi:hypothetical protein